jgi:hypothetical protein
MFTFGQNGAALERANAILAPDNIMEVKGKQLIVVGFREGKKVKTDKVNMLDLDLASVAFDSALSIVSVSCFSDMGECVQRQLHADGQKNYRWRIAFDVKNRTAAETLMVAIREMLNETHKK